VMRVMAAKGLKRKFLEHSRLTGRFGAR
jgi:hypothetical protein